jgi:amino-acid N-acetyltransferase
MPDTPADSIAIRPACTSDVAAIQTLIRPFVAAQQLLARTDQEIEWLATHGFAAVVNEQLVGFAAVEIYSRKLAEIQCLAVAAEMHGRGIGKRLVERCVQCANEHGILELMAISTSDDFLMQCGFDYSLPNQKRALFIHPADARKPAP